MKSTVLCTSLGGVTFPDESGAVFNGIDSLVNTEWRADIDATKYALNDAMMSVFIVTAEATNRGAYLGASTCRILKVTNSTIRTTFNDTSGAYALTISDDTVFTLKRDNSSNFGVYKDATLNNTVTSTTSFVPNAKMLIGASDVIGTPIDYSDSKIFAIAYGAGDGFDVAEWNASLRQLKLDLA